MLTDLLTNSIFPLNIGQHFDVSGNISQHRHNVDWFHLSLAIVLTNSVFPVNLGQHFDVSVNISQSDYSTQSSFSLDSVNQHTYVLSPSLIGMWACSYRESEAPGSENEASTFRCLSQHHPKWLPWRKQDWKTRQDGLTVLWMSRCPH